MDNIAIAIMWFVGWSALACLVFIGFFAERLVYETQRRIAFQNATIRRLARIEKKIEYLRPRRVTLAAGRVAANMRMYITSTGGYQLPEEVQGMVMPDSQIEIVTRPQFLAMNGGVVS